MQFWCVKHVFLNERSNSRLAASQELRFGAEKLYVAKFEIKKVGCEICGKYFARNKLLPLFTSIFANLEVPAKISAKKLGAKLDVKYCKN